MTDTAMGRSDPDVTDPGQDDTTSAGATADLDRRMPAWPSLPAMVRDQAARLGDREMVFAKRGGSWRGWTMTDVLDHARCCAAGLWTLGIGDGDRVYLVAENRPEWLVADLGIMAAGAITVPGYTTYTVDDHRHALTDSGAKVMILASPALLDRIWPAALQAPALQHIVVIDDGKTAEGSPEQPVVGWDDLLDRSDRTSLAAVEARIDRLSRSDVACIIYTSGTAGHPRGVMLTHGGILQNCYGAFRVLQQIGITDDERFLSFLPLSHAYERTAGQAFPLCIGAEIWYAQGTERLLSDLAEVQPTIMTAVPRLFEVFHGRIARQIEKQPVVRQKLFARAVALGRKRLDNGRLTPFDAIQDLVLDRLVRDTVRQRFGGRLKVFVSGGAPLPYDIGAFFAALGLRVCQGYGQTEASPVISVNLPNRIKLNAVGPPLHGTEVRIAEDGEILVRGECLMVGYWNDPEATEATLQDGWLYTGDIGVLDDDGDLHITDRKKDLIVTAGGDNVAPSRIEGKLQVEPEIGQAVVLGNGRAFLAGLIVPDMEWATGWAQRHGKPTDLPALIEDDDFRRCIDHAVDRVNADLSRVERVRRIHLLGEPFSIDNGLLTQTMKVRRPLVTKHHADAIERLYREER